MMTPAKFSLLFLFATLICLGQTESEFKMTFPSIYFKHNSTNYATMPYTVDSCFKHIASHIKDINSRPIWRDSGETEKLTQERIKKLKTDLEKYLGSKKINIQSMGNEQKISQRTIYSISDSTQIHYLLSINSVFDVSRTRVVTETTKLHKGWHLPCWMNWQLNKAGRQRCKTERRGKKSKGKSLPRIVWCGWKHGFHWSSVGKPKK